MLNNKLVTLTQKKQKQKNNKQKKPVDTQHYLLIFNFNYTLFTSHFLKLFIIIIIILVTE